MKVLCIIDQDHERWDTILDHTSDFKALYWIANPPFMG